MQQISIVDYVLLPIYLYFIYRIAFALRNKYYPEGHPWRKYFIRGLTVKIAGAILISLIYLYYYGGGDTLAYFEHIGFVNRGLAESAGSAWRVLTNTENLRSVVEQQISAQKYYTSPDTVTVWQLGFFVNLFALGHYLPLSVLLAFISYSGVWLIFRFFAEQYPGALKAIAVACLFIPTTYVWGSGLFKDTFCQMAVGWVLWAVYSTIGKRKWKLKYCLLLLAGGFILFKIKIYIFISFLPLVILSQISKRINTVSWALRIGLYLILLVALYKAIPTLQNVMMKASVKYSLENIGQTAKNSKEYFIRLAENDNGSTFDLGEIDPTLEGLFRKFVPAVNASLFRPYIWETRKPIVLIAAFEALAFLIVTVYALFMILRYRRLKILFDSNILFALTFSIIFSFFIAVTTSNFGSLSRYRIPMIPFYMSSLVLIIHFQRKPLIQNKKEERVKENISLPA